MTFERVFGRLVRFAARRSPIVLGCAAVLFVGFAQVTARLRFDPDLFALLPADLPSVQAFQILADEFGNLDRVVVAVEIPEGAPVEPYLDWSDALADELEQLPEVRLVERGVGEPLDWVREILPHWVISLDPGDREAAVELFSDAALDRRAAELRHRLLTPDALIMSELWRYDPAGLAEWLLSRASRQGFALSLDWSSGRFLSADHRLLALLVEPRGRPQDLEFDRRLVTALKAVLDRARLRWPELVRGLELEPPRVQLGGRHLITLEESELVRRDLWRSGLLSLASVLGFLWICYRRQLLLGLVFVPMTFGLMATLAVASGVLGKLSATAVAAAAVLVGLVNDFILLLYARYAQARGQGVAWEEALPVLASETGRGVTVGALTTAVAFLALRATSFEGLRELGTLVALGIAICLVSLWLLLPALLAWSERRRSRRGETRLPEVLRLGGGLLVRASWMWPRRALLALGLALALAVPGLLALRFDPSTLALRPKGGQAEAVSFLMREHFGGMLDPTVFVVPAPSLERLLERIETLTIAAKAASEGGELAAVESISQFLPPLERQREALNWLAERRRSGELEPQAVEKRLRNALLRNGLRPEGFEPGLELLRAALAHEHPLEAKKLLTTPQGRFALGRSLRQQPDGWWGLVQVSHPPDWPKQEVSPAVDRLAAIAGPDVRVAGMALLSREVRERVKADLWRSAVVAGVLVVCLLWFDVGSFRRVLLTLTPLALGLWLMVGSLSSLNQNLNLMNVFVLTMLLGIGVDYGLHLFHRSRELQGASDAEYLDGLARSGDGILIAAATTVLGFGALSVSHYPGLVSIGHAAVVGTASCVLAALSGIPAILALRRERQQRAPSRESKKTLHD